MDRKIDITATLFLMVQNRKPGQGRLGKGIRNRIERIGKER